MDTSPIVMIYQFCGLLLMLAMSCQARSFDVDKAILQILTADDEGSYFPSDKTKRTEVNDEMMVKIIQAALQPDTQPSKRIFCNGFRGCRGRKRGILTKPEIPKEPRSRQIQKKPFCNGFFGCANGKRSMGESLKQQIPDQTGIESGAWQDFRKRLFCNTYGCLNGKRASPYNDALIERLLSKEDGDVNLPNNAGHLPIIRSSSKVHQTFDEGNGEDDVNLTNDMSKPDDISITMEWCANSDLCKILLLGLDPLDLEVYPTGMLSPFDAPKGAAATEQLTENERLPPDDDEQYVDYNAQFKNNEIPEDFGSPTNRNTVVKRCNAYTRKLSDCIGKR